MDKRTELKGIIKEVMQETPNDKLEELATKAAKIEEDNAKLLESNTELKSKLEDMQGKIITMNTKTAGIQKYIFKGFDPETSKNFKSTLTSDESEAVAKVYLNQLKANRDGSLFETKSVDGIETYTFDGSYAIPVQYGNAVMGLAELTSVALTYANVIVIDAPTIKLPSKGTRSNVDSQASGTANAAGTPTLGQITWTIDKRVGNYIEILNDQLDDSNFDLINTFIVPLNAEAVGQNADDEMMNGTEFTTSVSGVTASVTAADATGIAAAITFANLNTMYYAVEWERGLGNCMWFGSRAALKDVSALVDSYGRPIFQQTPINGKPSQTLLGSQYVITPVISNTPADGAIRLAFGDPKHYTIFIRGSKFVSMVNPYVKMKEDITQFICKARMDGNVDDHATVTSSGAFTTMKRSD